MAAKKRSIVGVSDILCPLVKSPKFDIQSDTVYKIWNDQLKRYAYGRDIIIQDGLISVSKSFVKTTRSGWNERDDSPGNLPSYTLDCRLDLDNDGQFKVNYFNIVQISHEGWVNIDYTEAGVLVDSKIAIMNLEFQTYLKTAPVLIRFWHLNPIEFIKTTWLGDLTRLISK